MPAAADGLAADDTAAAGDQTAPALSDIRIPAVIRPPIDAPAAPTYRPVLAAERDDIERFARRRMRREPRRRKRPGGLLPLAAALAATIAVLIGWREAVVRQTPQLASLYRVAGLPVNLRGLNFADVKVSNASQDGVPVLLVEGTIVSVARAPVEVPRLRFAMRNHDGGEVYAWTTMPAQNVLAPGATLPFRSRLASPPSEASDVEVRFTGHHDRVAGIR
jgi:hypothetical protein